MLVSAYAAKSGKLDLKVGFMRSSLTYPMFVEKLQMVAEGSPDYSVGGHWLLSLLTEQRDNLIPVLALFARWEKTPLQILDENFDVGEFVTEALMNTTFMSLIRKQSRSRVAHEGFARYGDGTLQWVKFAHKLGVKRPMLAKIILEKLENYHSSQCPDSCIAEAFMRCESDAYYDEALKCRVWPLDSPWGILSEMQMVRAIRFCIRRAPEVVRPYLSGVKQRINELDALVLIDETLNAKAVRTH